MYLQAMLFTNRLTLAIRKVGKKFHMLKNSKASILSPFPLMLAHFHIFSSHGNGGIEALWIFLQIPRPCIKA